MNPMRLGKRKTAFYKFCVARGRRSIDNDIDDVDIANDIFVSGNLFIYFSQRTPLKVQSEINYMAESVRHNS